MIYNELLSKKDVFLILVFLQPKTVLYLKLNTKNPPTISPYWFWRDWALVIWSHYAIGPKFVYHCKSALWPSKWAPLK